MASQTAAVFRKAIQSVADADSGAVSDRELLRRFAVGKDQAAFAALVGRHSDIVLGVCRRTLPTWQDAEDACQATFLVLAQKAKSRRWQPSIANYLYATARKVAHNARVAAERRAKRERRAAVSEAVPPVDRMTGRELLAVLDEELDKLPPRYREPLILCYLEGLTRDETAARLGIVAGTLKIRLVRGRKRLSEALTKRGVVLGAGMLALAVTSPAEAFPPRLAESILATVAGTPATAVAALARGVAVNGIVNKIVLALVVMVGIAALGIGWRAALSAGQPALVAAAENRLARDVKPPVVEKELSVAGRVLDLDGKPVVEAVIVLATAKGEEKVVKDLAKTDTDGRFRCDVPAAERTGYRTLVARATGFAADWFDLPSGKKPGEEVVFHLGKAGIPVRGRVLTLEGQPVAGAVVHVARIYSPDGKNGLKEVYEMWPGDPARAAHLLQKTLNMPDAAGLPETVTVDAAGRFEIKGVGDGRLLMLQLTGDPIEHVTFRVATDDKFDPKAVLPDPAKADPRRGPSHANPLLYGPTFDHAARPCRPIMGTITDQKTGKPLASVVVSGHLPPGQGWWENGVHTKTDAEGKFRLLGLPNAPCQLAFGHAAKDWVYLMLQAAVAKTEGLAPARCDQALVRGMVVTGRVTDRETGQPIKGNICYTPLLGNKDVLTLPGKDIHMTGSMAYGLNADGRFRFVAPPGLAIVLVQVETRMGDQKPYPQVHLRAEDREKPYFRIEDGLGEIFLTAGGIRDSLTDWNGYQVIEPEAGKEAPTVNFVLDPGQAVAVNVVGPDGKPFRGATVAGVAPGFEKPMQLGDDTFTIHALEAKENRLVAAIDVEKKLAGTLLVSADSKGPAVLKLGAWGIITGRLIDPDGKPIAGASVRMRYQGHGPALLFQDLTKDRAATTDADGRFRQNAPFADAKLAINFSRQGRYLNIGGDYRNLTLAAGEAKALGDVKVAPEE